LRLVEVDDREALCHPGLQRLQPKPGALRFLSGLKPNDNITGEGQSVFTRRLALAVALIAGVIGSQAPSLPSSIVSGWAERSTN